jgi:hypothetical protein
MVCWPPAGRAHKHEEVPRSFTAFKSSANPSWSHPMSFEEAMQLANRDERFKATLYAMNTLLIHKGVYTAEEFQQLFSEWVGKEVKNNARSEQHSKARFCEA